MVLICYSTTSQIISLPGLLLIFFLSSVTAEFAFAHGALRRIGAQHGMTGMTRKVEFGKEEYRRRLIRASLVMKRGYGGNELEKIGSALEGLAGSLIPSRQQQVGGGSAGDSPIISISRDVSSGSTKKFGSFFSTASVNNFIESTATPVTSATSSLPTPAEGSSLTSSISPSTDTSAPDPSPVTPLTSNTPSPASSTDLTILSSPTPSLTISSISSAASSSSAISESTFASTLTNTISIEVSAPVATTSLSSFTAVSFTLIAPVASSVPSSPTPSASSSPDLGKTSSSLIITTATISDPNISAGQSQATSSQVAAFVMPGRTLSVLPIGLGIFAGVTVLALIIVGVVTYERKGYRLQFRNRKKANLLLAAGGSMDQVEGERVMRQVRV